MISEEKEAPVEWFKKELDEMLKKEAEENEKK